MIFGLHSTFSQSVYFFHIIFLAVQNRSLAYIFLQFVCIIGMFFSTFLYCIYSFHNKSLLQHFITCLAVYVRASNCFQCMLICCDLLLPLICSSNSSDEFSNRPMFGRILAIDCYRPELHSGLISFCRPFPTVAHRYYVSVMLSVCKLVSNSGLFALSSSNCYKFLTKRHP